MDSLEQTVKKIVRFRDARDWSRFYTPRNLAAALATETAELQETMLWKTDPEVAGLLKRSKSKAAIGAEIGDVLIFALLFCAAAGIDPISAIHRKLRINAARYPVKLAKGNAKKHTQLRAGANQKK
jgi:dCTP diphosphatase